MKRIILFIIAIGISCLTLTACNHKENDNNSYADNSEKDTVDAAKTDYVGELEDIHSIFENIDISFQKAMDKNYDNLDLSNMEICFPEIEEYHNLLLYESGNATFDEIVDNIRTMVETYFPDHQYSEDNLFYWGTIGHDSDSSYPNGWNKYPKVIENKEAIVEDGIACAFIYESDSAGRTENDAYLLIGPHTLAGTLVKGLGRTITDGEYEHLAGWFPAYTYEYVGRYGADAVPDEAYKLYDREVSLTEAVDFSVNFFENNYIPSSITQITTEVEAIEVMRCGDIFGYRILLKNLFDNIAFDYVLDLSISSLMSDDKDYALQISEAFMAQSDDIDFWYISQPYARVEWDGEAITNIISLEDAIEIISEKLTKSVKFEVNSMEFVYCPLAFEEGSEVTTAEAAWKMEAVNPNDGRIYSVYVNAVTGEIRYYTSIAAH